MVAAFDAVKRTAGKAQVQNFRLNNILGVEQDAEIVALALVNMIFRGDGKSKITEGNCFQKNIVKDSSGDAVYSRKEPTPDQLAVTRVLMNPPFALKTSDEKEFKFVEHALKQMQDGGILFSILPYSNMVRSGPYEHWRRTSLLANHTLLSVITFHRELFYPADIYPLAIVVKKGVPHAVDAPVLWLRALNDGLAKHKRKRLPNPRAGNDFPAVRAALKPFVADQTHPVTAIPRFQCVAPIDFDDPHLDLVPEIYLPDRDERVGDIEHEMTKVLLDATTQLLARSVR